MERSDYRANLSMCLEAFDYRRLLTPTAVAQFLGISRQTAAKRYPFKDGYISVATLARQLCSE